MTERKFCLYKHTTPNKKVYIGITSTSPNKRWQKGIGYKHNEHFYRAIKKYGWGNIKHEILFTGLSKEEAEEKEIELISIYKSNDKKFGYNIESGGNCINSIAEESKLKMSKARKGIKLSKDTRNKISIALIGRKLSEQTKQRISIAKKNMSNETKQKMSIARRGKKLSVETRKKLSDSHKGKTPINRIMVICKETNQVFESITAAGKSLGIQNSHICQCCKGERNMAGGYHWAYTTEKFTQFLKGENKNEKNDTV